MERRLKLVALPRAMFETSSETLQVQQLSSSRIMSHPIATGGMPDPPSLQNLYVT